MRLRLPKYTSKDYLVLAIVLLPITITINGFIFGLRYVTSLKIFLSATVITATLFALYFTLCGGIAVLMKKRFPEEYQVPRRLTLMIFSFLMMTGLMLLFLFRSYESIQFFDYRFDEDSFVWTYFAMGIGNVFLTFLHEAIARYEVWKSNFRETEQLKKAWRQSRIYGLKSQVNPHFLFNSLNTLSSLISEDEAMAEKFLDEMSKVYRYMLRNDDDPLVMLKTELTFLESYIYLLQVRYGDGLKVIPEIADPCLSMYLPPLALQTIIENAITQNSISKNHPLDIHVRSTGSGQLEISHKLQPKKAMDTIDAEAELDNLVKKYDLLGRSKVAINEDQQSRTILLPLMNKEEEVVL